MSKSKSLRVVVVTAVDEERTEHLVELAESISGQGEDDATGWGSVVWSVRFDGPSSNAAASDWGQQLRSVADGRHLTVVVGGNGVRRGTATTRTMALYAADAADWVLSVDADDMLASGALRALGTATLDAERSWAGWISGRSVRFGVTEDGGVWQEPREDTFGVGSVVRGAIVGEARSGNLAPITPNTILYRAQLLEALGGWPALVSAEDLGLLYTASELVDGWRIADTVLLRRRWSGQVTAKDGWHTADHDLFVEAALRRAAAASTTLRFVRPRTTPTR